MQNNNKDNAILTNRQQIINNNQIQILKRHLQTLNATTTDSALSKHVYDFINNLIKQVVNFAPCEIVQGANNTDTDAVATILDITNKLNSINNPNKTKK